MARDTMESLNSDRERIEDAMREIRLPADNAIDKLGEAAEEIQNLYRGNIRVNQDWLVLEKRLNILMSDIRIAQAKALAPHADELDAVWERIKQVRGF